MARLVTKKEFSSLAGVSPAAITKASGKSRLKAAVKDGRIDLGHPAAKEYLSGRKPAKPTPASEPPASEPPASEPPTSGWAARNQRTQEDAAAAPGAEEYLGMTLRDIISRHETSQGFLDWLKAIKLIADIQEKNIKADIIKSEVVSRDLVARFVLAPVEAAHKALLTDGAATIAGRVRKQALAGASEVEISKAVQGVVSRHIASVKEKIRLGLESAGKNEGVEDATEGL